MAIVNKVAVYVYEGTSPEDAISRPPKWTIKHNEGSLTESLAFVPGTYDLYVGGEEGWLKFLPAAPYGPGPPAKQTGVLFRHPSVQNERWSQTGQADRRSFSTPVRPK